MPDFRFRLPAIDDLTVAQKVALAELKPLLVTGGPGSGKTVVSIFRFLKQISKNRNTIFFTFNRTLMSSIRGTLRQRANVLLPNMPDADVEEIAKANIGSIHEWYGAQFGDTLSDNDAALIESNFRQHIVNRAKKYKELFVDESQDLRPVIIEKLYELSEKISCSADRSQDLQGHYIEPADDMIFEILNNRKETIRQELTANFRNTREIFRFARSFVPEDRNVQDIEIDELPEGEAVDLRANLSEQEQLDLIKEIIQQNPNSNIGIIVHFKKEIIRIKEHLEANGYRCDNDAEDAVSFSYYYSKMPGPDKVVMESRLQTPFILSYESCKGLEFDIVILPLFNTSDWALNHVRKNNDVVELDANGNPKYWAIPNHYYVAATRARRQLYVSYNSKPSILDFYNDTVQPNLFTNDDLPF